VLVYGRDNPAGRDEDVKPECRRSWISSFHPQRTILADSWQIGRFDCGGYEEKLFERHSQLAKAALTENKRVKLEHFVADGL